MSRVNRSSIFLSHLPVILEQFLSWLEHQKRFVELAPQIDHATWLTNIATIPIALSSSLSSVHSQQYTHLGHKASTLSSCVYSVVSFPNCIFSKKTQRKVMPKNRIFSLHDTLVLSRILQNSIIFHAANLQLLVSL